jgi:predicted Ser/Thr protein kinase
MNLVCSSLNGLVRYCARVSSLTLTTQRKREAKQQQKRKERFHQSVYLAYIQANKQTKKASKERLFNVIQKRNGSNNRTHHNDTKKKKVAREFIHCVLAASEPP